MRVLLTGLIFAGGLLFLFMGFGFLLDPVASGTDFGLTASLAADTLAPRIAISEGYAPPEATRARGLTAAPSPKPTLPPPASPESWNPQALASARASRRLRLSRRTWCGSSVAMLPSWRRRVKLRLTVSTVRPR